MLLRAVSVAWSGLLSGKRRRVFGKRVVDQATTGYFDGYGYSHFRIAGACGHLLLDGERRNRNGSYCAGRTEQWMGKSI
jgi:hypothetical protein